MRWITGAIAWVYDFLAEDMVLLVGAIVAILITALAVRVVPNAAGYILWAMVIVVLVASLWRTVSASRA